MQYYRIYFAKSLDYAYSKEQLINIIGNNKVRKIELCVDNKIIKVYKSLKEIKECDL